jgi:hypothetical protein
MRRSIAVAGATALVLFALPASPARADQCIGAKLKAVAKKESGLLVCQAKVAATGDSSGLSACETKVMGKFSAAFGKAGSCAGDEAGCEALADTCESSLASVFVDSFPSACESAKRKAAGKLVKAELGCYSKAARKEVSVDPSCISRARNGFGAALSRAGTCAAGGSPQDEVEFNCVDVVPVQVLVSFDIIGVCPATVCAGGAFLTTWGGMGSADGQFDFPVGVATDGTGNVFVADSANFRIQKFTNTGAFLTQWGSAGTGDGQFNGINGPWGIAVDGNGNVFVADTDNNRVEKFTNTGTFLLAFGWGVQDGMHTFETCTSSCQSGILGTGDGQFNGLQGIAVDTSGNVFVAGDFRIQKFTNSGNFLNSLGSPGAGNGQFNYAAGVAVDASGAIFAVDAGYPGGANNRIQKFDNNGTFVTTWGSLGSGDGQFNNPLGIAVDASGNVLVSDENNSRIQKFTNTGTFLDAWGSWGPANGQFKIPWGIAVDGNGNVFVADALNNRVEKFACP